jgi:endonuclease/exonuclease/phosphatase family metal-dependent hydrolase
MLDKTRSFFRAIFIVINLCVILLYLVVCLVPFINTGRYWFFALPGLAFPLLFFVLFGFIIFWIIAKSKWFWISLVVMLIGFQQIVSVFAFHLPQNLSSGRSANTLRILHWNVRSWDNFPDAKGNEKGYLPDMMDLLRQRNADVLCFEEYADIKNMQDSNSITSTIIRMGYPHHVFAETDPDEHKYARGVVIFSKYPIVQSDTFNYGKNTQAEHLVYIDLKRGDKTFRIFTTHLQSVRFGYSDYESLQRLKHVRDPGYHDSRTIVSKLKTAYRYRYQQAQLVKEKMEESPYPVVLTGDFNDVPNSNTYFVIKGKLQDAFLKKGFFIGRTFRFISPTLRIDYILADKSFKVNQFEVIHVPYSDHYPIEADLQW